MPEYSKQVTEQSNNKSTVPVKQDNTVPSSQIESDYEEDYGFDSEPEEDKNNTIQNNNNKNKQLNTNTSSKVLLSDAEEDHFEKTMETSMNNLNEIKDKSKTGQYDKIVNDQISEYSDDGISKANSSQARSRKLLHDKSNVSIESGISNKNKNIAQHAGISNQKNNVNIKTCQSSILESEDENYNPNPLGNN